MMSDVDKYVLEVLHAGIPMLGWHKRLARDLILCLLDDDILVDYIWFAVSGVSREEGGYVEMRALVYDENDAVLECAATWEYDKSIICTPTSEHWELSDIELREPVQGLIS